VNRISISEEDLDPGTPVVYAPVGGPAHPDVYGRVDPATLDSESAHIATWVLVVGAVILSIAFGVGGFVAGQSGRVSHSQLESTRAADRARFDSDQRTAIETATAKVRREDAQGVAERVRRATNQGIAKGRRIGLREAQQTADQAAITSAATGGDCLTAVQFC
jgi:hypothetical protein